MRFFPIFFFLILSLASSAQDFGEFPRIQKRQLLNDLDILYQALDKYHSGMYWYTPKDSVDFAFDQVKQKINRDLNALEFHKLIAPLVGLSREDHTDIHFSSATKKQIESQATFLPFTVAFLGKELYLVKDGSNEESITTGSRITKINGLTPIEIVDKIGSLFASDGYIQAVKYRDLEGFSFSRFYYYYFGNTNSFEIEIENYENSLFVKPLGISEIRENFANRYTGNEKSLDKESLEFELLTDSIAYLGIHTFSNSSIRENEINNNYSKFLLSSFATITGNNIKTLVIDVSENGGGTEGNEGLLYSYLSKNYLKYKRVRAKTQKATFDNGIDEPITFKTFGFFERVFGNKKMSDGSFERKKNAGYGLMAFRKQPRYKFNGKVFVIISPVTYSGGSEFSNMIYTNKRGVFVGEETGGGFYGNTSGYSRELELPNSKISIDIPALQFMMNVEGLPFGRGVIPHYEVIPTFEQYQNGENTALNFILDLERSR